MKTRTERLEELVPPVYGNHYTAEGLDYFITFYGLVFFVIVQGVAWLVKKAMETEEEDDD